MTVGQRAVGSAGERVVSRLRASGATLAVAESLTGGDLCGAVVAAPGASAVLRGGVVAYAAAVKAELLGVDPGLLARVGTVDSEVARQMARGVRELLRADWAVATTGVAGPGPAEGHPPGTVHVAVDGRAAPARSRAHRFRGDRSEVRACAVDAALDLLWQALEAPAPRAGHG